MLDDAASPPDSGQFEPLKIKCSSCNLRELCVPCCELTASERKVADLMVFNRLRVRRSEILYRSGDHFSSLYAVRSGFFKSTAQLDNAQDQVTRFSMAGEVLGLDGIGPGQHACNTIALEDSEVCAIPFAKLQEVAHAIPSLQRHLRRMMSREMVREQSVMLLLGSMNAEERLATLLLNLSKRLAARGYSPSEFSLRMTRQEMGSYLGLKLETVSRIFSKFHEEGLIDVQRKSIRILDSDGLARVMSGALS
jgi:CRP/FNR family transcriptional regulator